MNPNRRWAVLGVIVAAGLVLIAGSALIIFLFILPNLPAGNGLQPVAPLLKRGNLSSDGEQIYLTGTSMTPPPITAQMNGMEGMGMGPGRMACVTCHGPDGKGGTVRMMMGSFEAPDIRYATLISEHEDHPPYTDETIKRAITQGLDPAGQPLDWEMPRWTMSDAQLDDLIAYLKILK